MRMYPEDGGTGSLILLFLILKLMCVPVTPYSCLVVLANPEGLFVIDLNFDGRLNLLFQTKNIDYESNMISFIH